MHGLSFDCFPDISRRKATIARLLDEHPAPVFLAEKAILADRYSELKRSLEERWQPNLIAYSFKTNYPVAESRVLQGLGAWAEVVSDREYRMARRLGHPGDQIVFNGPYKTDGCLEQALEEGALINVNDRSELTRLIRIVERGSRPRKIGIRVRSAITGLGPSRFGFSLNGDEARSAVEQIAACSKLQLVGLHSHLPGDTDDPACYQEASRNVMTFLHESVPDYRNTIEYLDMGGSFPSSRPQPYTKKSWNPRPIAAYVEAIVPEFATHFDDPRPLLILEPGRYLVGDAIVFVSQVIDVKRSGERRIVLSNASISMVPLTHYSPQAIRAFSPDYEHKTESKADSVIYGASCREDDLLYKGEFPAVEVGDYLVHYAVGAYNSSLSPNFIFETPRTIFY